MAVRCTNYLNCTVTGFNFGYLTVAIAIVGISFLRRISAEPIKYSLRILNIVTGQAEEWQLPFQLYLYASFIPAGVSVVALLLAFTWVACMRPLVYPNWKANLFCKESTSVLFVLLMIGYTAALFPGPLQGLKFSDILRNNSAIDEFKDGMVEAIRNEEYYMDIDNVSPIGDFTPTEFGEAVDYLQRKYKCCGMRRWTDYTAYHLKPNFMVRYEIPLPFSCCVEFDTADNQTTEKIDWGKCSHLVDGFYYNASCSEHVIEQCKNGYYILDGAGFSAATIGVIAVVFSCTFATMNLVLHHRAEKMRADGGGIQLKRRGDRRA
ncbi:hypothetical protein CAPTEDRAFT_228059 [Capitella teleta]|uniref:Tetraspanin n=1 Tax=Capitella teleta TaxID=283909 RepID=R7TP49_CAPTE|nr:hypothetical protein CAPTEDRAFT_228059 [Capitella teleta]|eukprot:ELT92805.1 hypothetical protein CAPTEDRAFT_228059 [Capitella teleta]